MAKRKQTAKETPVRVIEAARRHVAERYDHQYHRNTILRGDWDNGLLIRNEIDRIEHLSEETEDDPE